MNIGDRVHTMGGEAHGELIGRSGGSVVVRTADGGTHSAPESHGTWQVCDCRPADRVGQGQFAPVVTARDYVVSGARVGARRVGIDPAGSTSYEIEVGGDDGWGHLVTGIIFYTGFAGCPARYYVTTVEPTTGRQQTTINNA